MERKKERQISVFIRLGLDRPHSWDRITKHERIRTKGMKSTADVFAEHNGTVFLFKN